jgi:crotonobetainyl-CoA:carnitine CoA-transferase CaiB-like acyl-CoA transferase
VRSAAPLLGADTDDVMQNMLDYSAEDIARLRKEQVLF